MTTVKIWKNIIHEEAVKFIIDMMTVMGKFVYGKCMVLLYMDNVRIKYDIIKEQLR